MQPVLIVLMIVWTTARHEASHALAAVMEGATIDEMRLLPGVHPELGFYFGYVRHHGPSTWLTDAAPFLVDAVLIAVGLAMFGRVESPRWRRIVGMFLVISPLIDLAYGYQGGLWRPGTDVADLFLALPDGVVHAYFLSVIVVGFLLLRRAIGRAHPVADDAPVSEPT